MCICIYIYTGRQKLTIELKALKGKTHSSYIYGKHRRYRYTYMYVFIYKYIYVYICIYIHMYTYIQPIPEEMRLEMQIEMQIEILDSGEISVI